MLTTDQVLAESKDVTRRLKWNTLAAGQMLQGVRKGMGLKKGEKVQKLKVMRIKSVRRERLDEMTRRPDYGREECRREGFPEMSPAEFVVFFCASHEGCHPWTKVNRIEFEYVRGQP